MELQRLSERAPIVTNAKTSAGECLFLYPYEDWCKMEARLVRLAPDNLKVQDYVRFLVSGASECPIDNQGRMLLPAYLREHAKIDRDVVIAGVGEKIELWSKSLFDDSQHKTLANFENIAGIVAGLGGR